MTDVPGSGGLTLVPLGMIPIGARMASTSLCALEPQFYALLIDGLNLNDDPMFANQWDKEQWQAGKEKFRSIFAAKTVKSGAINSKEPMFVSHPFLIFQKRLSIRITLRARPFTRDGIAQPSPAPKLSATPGAASTVPTPGTHTAEVLEALGLDSETLKKLVG